MVEFYTKTFLEMSSKKMSYTYCKEHDRLYKSWYWFKYHRRTKHNA